MMALIHPQMSRPDLAVVHPVNRVDRAVMDEKHAAALGRLVRP